MLPPCFIQSACDYVLFTRAQEHGLARKLVQEGLRYRAGDMIIARGLSHYSYNGHIYTVSFENFHKPNDRVSNSLDYMLHFRAVLLAYACCLFGRIICSSLGIRPWSIDRLGARDVY